MEVSIAQLRKNLAGHIKNLKQPTVILSHKKPVAILSPVTEEEMVYQSMKSGEITYDQYRRKMLGIGYQNLVDQKVIVRPSDIVNSEKVEVQRQRNRIEASEFLLDAAKFFQHRHERHICPNCSYIMMPKRVADEKSNQ